MKISNHIRSAVICTLFTASLLFTGCKKDSTTNTLTADDAADAMTSAMTTSTGGLSSQVSTAATYSYTQGAYKTSGATATLSLSCGVPFDTTFSFAYTGVTTASYSGQWDYLLTCSGSLPQSLTMSGSYTGSYDAPRIKSTNTGTRNWTLTGIDMLTSTPYTFNGSFTRTGSHTSKVRNQYTYNADITITVTNLTVSKTTGQITGGTGAVTMTGTVSNGNSYSFNGNVVFNGNGAATLTINGNTYSVTL